MPPHRNLSSCNTVYSLLMLNHHSYVCVQEPAGEKAGATMTADEEQDEGSVSFRVYWAYFKAGSGVLAIAILAMLAAAEAMSQYQQVMLCFCFYHPVWSVIAQSTIIVKVLGLDSNVGIHGILTTLSRVTMTAAQAVS